MDSLSTLHNPCHRPLTLTLNHHRPVYSSPISSLSFKPLKISSFPKLSSKIRASQSSSTPTPPNPPKPLFSQILKFSCIALTTAAVAAALFIARLTFKPSPVFAATPIATTTSDAISDEQEEMNIEESLNSNPDDVEALRSLMESKIKNRKPYEAIGVVEKLIELQPNDPEWPLLKCHLYIYSGESDLAKAGFENLIAKDPLRVEAYHGLAMAVSQCESVSEELTQVAKRIETAMQKCKKEKNNVLMRDFKLLSAQIRVIESNYDEALKIYQQLVKEEPRDFRPYLCQGIIYTLLKKKDEADKQFEKYQKLVPKEHPYAQYFDDNMFATKVFSQRVENEAQAGSRA